MSMLLGTDVPDLTEFLQASRKGREPVKKSDASSQASKERCEPEEKLERGEGSSQFNTVPVNEDEKSQASREDVNLRSWRRQKVLPNTTW